MKKFYWIAKNTWEEMLTYRLSFTVWRLRNVILILSTYFLWLSVMPEQGVLFGYDQSTMLTYILGTSILLAIVTSTRTYEIGEEINQGNLSNYILRPINFFLYKFAMEMGDKAMNISFAVVELGILLLILRPPIFIQTDIATLILFAISIILAVIMLFFIDIIMGFVGFWSPEVWAPRYLFWIVFGFFAGTYFPLDILPETLYNIFQALPFQYFVYFPLKIYLGQLTTFEILKGFSIATAWIFFFYFTMILVWKRGLRNYSAQGR